MDMDGNPQEERHVLRELRILGVRFHAVEMEDAMATIEGWVRTGQRGRYVIVTGMHGVLEGFRDSAFREILNQADLFVPDGFSLVWVARRKGVSLKHRVCGTDLMWRFCQLAAQRGYRMFFYGDTNHVLRRLRERCQRELPTLAVVGTYSPPFRPLTAAEDAQVVETINAAQPDVLWVGLGLPKQERWIVEHRDRLNARTLVAVGAAFKFVSGDVRRAPRILGEHGLEWLWRFLHEPQRLWRRALLDVPLFTCLVLLELVGLLKVRNEVRTGLPNGRMGQIMKRTFDIILATVGLLLSLPLWVILVCLIKWQDGGPVFYAQARVGQGGRRFKSLKFRTMIVDADERYGPRQAGENDVRITPVGKWLRATALDELPQLWNILKGDMSFVGPRALAPGEIEITGDGTYVPLEAIPMYESRHRVRPGLTGIAQIFAPRDVPRKQKFRYDLFYISNQRFLLDLGLIVLSFWISMRGKWESRVKKI